MMKQFTIALLTTAAIAAFSGSATAASCSYYLEFGADAYFECLDRTQA